MRCLDASARAGHSRPAILLTMEPHPPDHGPGRIIFLNGACSSGKSTLAKAMQEALPAPFLHVSSDHLVASGMLPARRDPDGPVATALPAACAVSIQDGDAWLFTVRNAHSPSRISLAAHKDGSAAARPRRRANEAGRCRPQLGSA